MNHRWIVCILVLTLPLAAATGPAAEKPRVFITDSASWQLNGEAALGNAKGFVKGAGGGSRQTVEVIKTFARRCPQVVVTANRDKADFVVRLDHEEPNPLMFLRQNKVAVFDRDEDLIYSGSTRLLGNAVKEACAAITPAPARP